MYQRVFYVDRLKNDADRETYGAAGGLLHHIFDEQHAEEAKRRCREMKIHSGKCKCGMPIEHRGQDESIYRIASWYG